ncbi:22621_t:CDS:1, partial [Cetraspora pellucida]
MDINVKKREAQMALITLKSQYNRALELMERVWKLDLYTTCLCILCIVIGCTLLFLKKNVVNLNSIVSLGVSSAGFLVSGGSAIAAFKSLLTSSSESDSGIENADKGPNFDLAESAALI